MTGRAAFAAAALVAALLAAAETGAVRAAAAPQAAHFDRAEAVRRWVAADPKHRHAASLGETQAVPSNAARLHLRAAVLKELAIPGRYRLNAGPAMVQGESWWQRLFDWIGSMWDKLWRSLSPRTRVGPGGAVAIGDLLIGAVALVLLFAIVRLVSNLQIERRARIASQPLDAPGNAWQLYAQATRAAAAGDYAAASRWLFLAGILALDLRGAVRADRSATVGDLRRALRARDSSLVQPFDDIALPFTIATYAQAPVARGEFDRAAAAFTAIARPRGTA